MKRDELMKAISETVEARIADSRAEYERQTNDEVKHFIRDVVQRERGRDRNGEVKGQGFARMLRSLAATKGDPEAAAKWSEKYYKDESVAKALSTGDFTAGGVFVPEEMSSEIIELLRPTSVVRAAGPRIQPMETGVMSIPRMTGGASAEWLGESQAQNASQPTTGSLQLVWKKLRATVPVSNEMLRFATTNVDEMVRNDAVQALGTKQDVAFIRGDGTEYSPRGLKNWANFSEASAGDTLANIDEDILDLINALDTSDVTSVNRAFIMSARDHNKLRQLRTDQDVPAFPEVRERNQLFGIPIFSTNNIPTNLGGGTESEVFLVEFNDVILGEGTSLEVVVSNEATYTDSGGTLVSAFDRDETVMKVIQRLDMVVRHPEAVAVKTGVTWGA